VSSEDILEQAKAWLADGETIALATVVATWGSSPRPAGSRMAITQSGKMAGSVSGGCIEAAIVDAAQHSFVSGQPQLLHYGVTDERAWGVGLACGGKLTVFLERVA
jgi:xanthine dehydrogenase accessory factor